MPGKTPQRNGKEPRENGIQKNSKDAEVKAKGKKSAKDNDEEITVVVPPSKNSKQTSGKKSADAEGDVAMGDEENADDEVEVDPVAQTVAGEPPT